MRNKIFGGIGVIWGGLIIANRVVNGGATGASEAYQSGQNSAVIFGAVMFIVGLYYFLKKSPQN